MFSVFSDKLKRAGIFTGNLKPSEIMIQYKHRATEYCYIPFISDDKNEPLYIVCNLEFLIWVNKNILFKIIEDDYKTIGVKLRIATGMLNKLASQSKIPEEIASLYHTRLVSNVKAIQMAIMLEDLPF